MEEADVKYHVIRAWWLSSRVTIKDGMYILSTWLGFWHYRCRQWGSNMLMVGVLGVLIVYLHEKSMFQSWFTTLFYIIYITLEPCAKMPTCNLTKTMHNKWLQQSCNKMTRLYKAKVDDVIWTFMQFTKHCSWLKGGSSGKRPNQMSLKLIAATHTSDPKLLAEIMRSYPWANDLSTRTCALEGSELFGSTKRKLDLSSWSK